MNLVNAIRTAKQDQQQATVTEDEFSNHDRVKVVVQPVERFEEVDSHLLKTRRRKLETKLRGVLAGEPAQVGRDEAWNYAEEHFVVVQVSERRNPTASGLEYSVEFQDPFDETIVEDGDEAATWLHKSRYVSHHEFREPAKLVPQLAE